MKRHPSLQPLSDDHHRALVLARRLRRFEGADPADLEALARDVRRELEGPLEAHFQVEERELLPALEKTGAAPLAARTREDHARLRALVRAPWAAETASRLGALLEKHVRFEERTLFPEAEARLSEAQLACVRRAARPQR